MKTFPIRRQWLALAAVKLLALGAAFALPSLMPSQFPSAIAAPPADTGLAPALR